MIYFNEEVRQFGTVGTIGATGRAIAKIAETVNPNHRTVKGIITGENRAKNKAAKYDHEARMARIEKGIDKDSRKLAELNAGVDRKSRKLNKQVINDKHWNREQDLDEAKANAKVDYLNQRRKDYYQDRADTRKGYYDNKADARAKRNETMQKLIERTKKD